MFGKHLGMRKLFEKLVPQKLISNLKNTLYLKSLKTYIRLRYIRILTDAEAYLEAKDKSY